MRFRCDELGCVAEGDAQLTLTNGRFVPKPPDGWTVRLVSAAPYPYGAVGHYCPLHSQPEVVAFESSP